MNVQAPQASVASRSVIGTGRAATVGSRRLDPFSITCLMLSERQFNEALSLVQTLVQASARRPEYLHSACLALTSARAALDAYKGIGLAPAHLVQMMETNLALTRQLVGPRACGATAP